MKKIQIWFWRMLLFAVFCLSGCGETKAPVEILTFRAFHLEHDEREIGIYVDWQNKSEQKSIDGIILELVCDEDYEQAFQYYLLESVAVLPEAHNQKNIIIMPSQELTDLEVHSLEISILQVNYTDGSIWESDRQLPSLIVEVDEDKGDGVFPARLNEAVFFESYAGASETKPVYFQVDWINISDEASILAVDYQITAKTVDGTIFPTEDGENEIYISEYYGDTLKWISPGSHNENVTHSVYNFELQQAIRENDNAIYEITISRVVDSQGIVWENSNKENQIETVLCGKKGYAFQNDISNESVDIRIELSDINEVLPDKVIFVYYSKQENENMEEYVQSCLDQICKLRLCICPAVLYDRPYEELMETLKEYNEDHDRYLSCEDPEDGVFGRVVNILDVNNNVINCTVIGVGEDLHGLPEDLFWVRENPWSKLRIQR